MVPTCAMFALSFVGTRELLDLGDDRGHGLVDAALDVHRVVTGFDEQEALRVDRLREHGRGRRAVAGLVARLARDLAHHLGADVLELVGELDLLGDGDAVLGHDRRAEALLDDDVAALRAERDLHGVGEGVDAVEDGVAGVAVVGDLLGAHGAEILEVLGPRSEWSGTHDLGVPKPALRTISRPDSASRRVQRCARRIRRETSPSRTRSRLTVGPRLSSAPLVGAQRSGLSSKPLWGIV